MNIRYYKNLTIEQNAEKNECSVSTVKAHLLKLNLSASKARCGIISEKVNGAKVELEKAGKRVTIKSICEVTGYANKTVIKYLKISVKKDIAKSTPISYSNRQGEILQNIINLYNSSNPIECDLTYSVGKMWKGLQQPIYLFDLKPQLKEVKPLDEVMQYNDYFDSCLFDLPFIIRPKSEQTNSIIFNRFDAFSSEKELLETNVKMLELAFKILKNKAICIIKTQDTCYANKQIWVHRYIMDEAEKIGFIVEDVFICLAKNMLVDNCKSAIHARKQHCYFIVLKKLKKK